jgi:hypothetical protein
MVSAWLSRIEAVFDVLSENVVVSDRDVVIIVPPPPDVSTSTLLMPAESGDGNMSGPFESITP